MTPAHSSAARRIRVGAIALILSCAPGAGFPVTNAAEVLAPERQRELLREALNAFDEAVSLVRDDPTRAEQLYRESVMLTSEPKSH